jgi:hypothetical protein
MAREERDKWCLGGHKYLRKIWGWVKPINVGKTQQWSTFTDWSGYHPVMVKLWLAWGSSSIAILMFTMALCVKGFWLRGLDLPSGYLT